MINVPNEDIPVFTADNFAISVGITESDGADLQCVIGVTAMMGGGRRERCPGGQLLRATFAPGLPGPTSLSWR